MNDEVLRAVLVMARIAARERGFNASKLEENSSRRRTWKKKKEKILSRRISDLFLTILNFPEKVDARK